MFKEKARVTPSKKDEDQKIFYLESKKQELVSKGQKGRVGSGRE